MEILVIDKNGRKQSVEKEKFQLSKKEYMFDFIFPLIFSQTKNKSVMYVEIDKLFLENEVQEICKDIPLNGSITHPILSEKTIAKLEYRVSVDPNIADILTKTPFSVNKWNFYSKSLFLKKTRENKKSTLCLLLKSDYSCTKFIFGKDIPDKLFDDTEYVIWTNVEF